MAANDLSLKYNNLGDVITPVAEGFGNYAFNNLLGVDSNWGGGLGTLFAQGSSAALGRMGSNLYKGQSLFEGVGQDAEQALAGAGVGMLSNWTGRGITSAMGDSTLGRGIGAGTATALGGIGGTIASNLVGFGSIAGKADKLFGTMSTAKKAVESAKLANAMQSMNIPMSQEQASKFFKSGAINPYALGMQVAGTALGAMTGPSNEYGGTYGNITRTMDSIYDAATAGANFIPGVGQGISGVMALNKGLSNIFGSTDGMTVQDAILGSAFMPAPVKWLNMAGAKTTDTFKNQSWQNSEKAATFMQNSFGDLNKKFEKARAESGKTYGMFSHHAYTKARDNLVFANDAWNKVLGMADERELQNIRSQYMSSINNQRYSQLINGGWNPIARGKQGMKILNNATNHNIGQRLLSAAALIDNKAMILCNAHD